MNVLIQTSFTHFLLRVNYFTICKFILIIVYEFITTFHEEFQEYLPTPKAESIVDVDR